MSLDTETMAIGRMAIEKEMQECIADMESGLLPATMFGYASSVSEFENRMDDPYECQRIGEWCKA